jgi:hypothetical protein
MNIIAKSALALIATVSQAAALSCLAPDMARDFQRIAASDKSYVVLNGTFTFAARPARGDETRPETQSFASKFTGQLLTGGGFTDDIADVLITINSNCAASWCGEIVPDANYIAFVEQDGRKLTLQAEACPAYAFREPTAEMVKQIENCAAGKSCTPVN